VETEGLCVCVCGIEGETVLCGVLEHIGSNLSLVYGSITLHTNKSQSTALSVHVCVSIQLQQLGVSLVLSLLSLLEILVLS